MDKMYHKMNIAGIERSLPLCKVSDDLLIAAFIMLGDVEITSACAGELLALAPPHDIMITAETKGIPLLFEMARQNKENNYIVARKSQKVYMEDVVYTEVDSITTVGTQRLYIGKTEIEAMRNKRVLIIDDVISTGESVAALERLINKVDGNIVGKMCVLAEGDAQSRPDITYLKPLPVFNADGTIKE